MAKQQEKTIEQRLEEALVLYEKAPYKLPSNWCWVKLPVLYENVTSSDKKIPQKNYLLEGLYSIIDQGKDLVGGYTNDRKYLYDGELPVIIFGDHTRAVKYVDFEFAQGADGVKVLKSSKSIMPKYLYYCIKNLNIVDLGYRRHFPLFPQYYAPLAPLEEQKRIVGLIEKQFAKLDEARDLIQKSLDTFADRKSALLHKAFNGELTKSWREERHRNPTRQEVCIGDIAEINPKNEKIVCNDEYDVSFVPMKAVCEIKGEIKEVLFEKFKKVKKGFTFFKENDVLFAKITPCMENGKCFIATGLKKKFGFASTEFYVFRCGKSIDKKYLWYILRDQAFRNRAKQVMTGAVGQQRVPKAYLEKEKIALFDLDEQEEIVRILDSIFEKEDKSKELIDMLDKIDEMKKSILARAFRGELGTSNPSDEPAIELLKRILENKKGLKL